MPLHRPYIRKDVLEEVERRAERNEKGQFLDANTHQPIEGKYDLGHVYDHEFWREAEMAERQGLTQEEFNERMNNPDYYQIEDPHENRSHAHENHESIEASNMVSNGKSAEESSEKSMEGSNEESMEGSMEESMEESMGESEGQEEGMEM